MAKDHIPGVAAYSPQTSHTQRGYGSILFELGKVISFFLSILSLFPVIVGAFFEPGTHWEDRAGIALVRIALAACICFASGLFFYRPARGHDPGEPLMKTLPVRLFFWTMGGVAFLFVISWYLDAYFVPLMWRNQPYEMNSIAPALLHKSLTV